MKGFADTVASFERLPAASRMDYWRSNPHPIRYIKSEMKVNGWTQSDLAPAFGTRARVSEVLSQKRWLSVSMIRDLTFDFGLCPRVLLADYDLDADHMEEKPVLRAAMIGSASST